jgi:hypothetical protein
MNSACPKKEWCYAAEYSAYLYRVTLHSAIDMSHHEAWYGERALGADMHIWGFRVLFPNHNMKKSNKCAALVQIFGYDRNHVLLRWIDSPTDALKHAHAARFLDIDPTSPVITPGQQL